jgi:hypothetical protein
VKHQQLSNSGCAPRGLLFGTLFGTPGDVGAHDVRANIARIMDDVWSTIGFGIGRKNREDVDHELFVNDDA